MRETLTVLRSLSHPLTKSIVRTEAGLATRTDQNVRYYSATEHSVSDIRSLAQQLDKASADPRNCVVRGCVAPTADPQRMLRRKFERDGEHATLVEVPRRWLLLDFDGIEMPPGIDPFADAATTVQIVASKLPHCFHRATAWYQFTASAGIKPGVHIRMAFWLDRALGEAELKQWLAQSVAEPGQAARSRFKQYPIDGSVFGTVQPNYIAAPIIAPGAHDPLAGRCARSGLIDGEFDTVIVPPISATSPIKRATSKGAAVPIGSTFAECLAAIGDHDGGNGCHGALSHAVAVYWRRNGGAASADALRQVLIARVRDAEWDPKVHPAAYLRTELDRIDSLIESVRGQQKNSERQAEDDARRALCPWPDAGVSLEQAEPMLRQRIDEFFNIAVPAGADMRADYEAAYAEFRTELGARHELIASAELGDFEDADAIFEADLELKAPPPPAYAQHGIKITPGAGKSYAATARMVQEVEAGRTFVVAVPTQDKAEEAAALANTLAGKLIAAVWRGIDREDPGVAGTTMCRRSETVKQVVKASGAIGDVCGSPQRGYCPFHPAVGGPCAYRRQADQSPAIWVVTHATLSTPPQPSMQDADALIVDEALSLGGHREDDLSVADLIGARKVPSKLDTLLPRLQRALGTIAPGDYISRACFEDEGFTPDTCEAARRCENFGFERVGRQFDPRNDHDDIAAKVQGAGDTNRIVQARRLFWSQVTNLLESRATLSARLRMLPGDGASIHISAPVRPHARWLDRPVLHIDATLDPVIVQQWLPAFELVADIRVEKGDGVTVFQIADRPVGYGQIIPGVGSEKDAAKRRAQENTLQDIMRKIETLAAEDRRFGGVTACVAPKEFEAAASERWALWGSQPPNLRLAHFGNIRGKNDMENCRRIIVISRPEPQAAALEQLASVEFDHHPSPAIGLGFYPTRHTALRTEGNSQIVVKDAYHPDRLVQAMLGQIRDAEVSQAIHRARPVRRGKAQPLVAEIISGVPVDIVVDQTGTFQDWIEASPAELLIARGMWPDAWEGKQAVLRDLYPTAQAVRRGFQEHPTALELRDAVERLVGGKGAQSPYRESLIRGLGTFQDVATWPRYRYRLESARRSHLVAVDPVLHPDAAAAWLGRLGRPLALFEAVDPGLGAPAVMPEGCIRLEAAPSIVGDILGIDRRDPAALPLPAAPLHVRTAAGQVRFWPDAGRGQPILVRTIEKRAQTRPATPAPEPLLTVEAICSHVGVSSFALKHAMSRARYRKLAGVERERAAIRWLTLKVGREQFIAAVRELGETMRENA